MHVPYFAYNSVDELDITVNKQKHNLYPFHSIGGVGLNNLITFSQCLQIKLTVLAMQSVLLTLSV